MKIRVRAMLVIISTNAVIILLSILAGTVYVRKNIEKYIEADMLVVADIADRFISSELDMLRYEAGEAAEGLTGTRAQAERMEVLTEQLRLYTKFESIAVMTRDFRVIAEAGAELDTAGLADNYAAERAFNGETAFTSTVPTKNGVKFYVMAPIPEDTENILILTLDGMYFSNLASEYHVWETGHIFIDDSEGYVIANIRPEWVQARQNFILIARDDPQYNDVASVIEKLAAGGRGIGYYSVNGDSRICAYRPITGSEEGWSLGIVAPLSESPVRNVERGLLLIAAVSILLNVAAAVIASNFIKKPFEESAALRARAEADLRENEKMMAEIRQRDKLLQTVNQAIDFLMRSEPEDFFSALKESMGMMARAVDADGMYIVKNRMEDGRLYRMQIYEWFSENGAEAGNDADVTVRISHDGGTPEIKEAMLRGDSVNVLVRDMTPADRERLSALGILSVLIVPVFIRDTFWGFVGFNNCSGERLFTKNEESIMRSGSLLLASALLRNEYMTGIRETSAKLEIALGDAERANSAKSSFLAHMSHEIRTPLNAVIGLSELTLDEGGLSGDTEANLEKINVAGATILSIVNDILDISKIESGKLEIYPVRYDTPSMINDVVTLNIVRIGEKPIAFKLSVDESLPGALIGDDLRVKQIFNNLLSNAFKYTNAGTVEWRVSFERDGDDVWFISDITDTGIGMRRESLDKLFTDYNQVDMSINRKVEGTGLGLAIAKRLVELMDGTITVESEYGKGSAFHVRLRQAFVSEAPIGKTVADNLMGLRYTLSKRQRNTRTARVNLSYARVLVVDDIATNLDVVKGMLKPYGVKVDCASSGRQAIEMIQTGSQRYSAVFMDHMMPGMDGVEAMRIIRELGTEYARSIPIIALTANAIVGNEEMFLSHGFQDFISKPIDISKLDAALRRWVRDKTLEKASAEAGEDGAGPEGEGESSEDAAAERQTAAVDGVDMKKALERFSGDEAVLIDVLRSYAANTGGLLLKLREYLETENPADYAIAVHGIKGASYGIYADEAGKAAEALETASKANDIDALRAGHAAFDKLMKKLLAGMNEALRKFDAGREKPTAAEPDAEQLRELRVACAEFDMDRADAAMNRLEAYSYESGGELVEWLRGRVNDMAFEEISGGDWFRG